MLVKVFLGFNMSVHGKRLITSCAGIGSRGAEGAGAPPVFTVTP